MLLNPHKPRGVPDGVEPRLVADLHQLPGSHCDAAFEPVARLVVPALVLEHHRLGVCRGDLRRRGHGDAARSACSYRRAAASRSPCLRATYLTGNLTGAALFDRVFDRVIYFQRVFDRVFSSDRVNDRVIYRVFLRAKSCVRITR